MFKGVWNINFKRVCFAWPLPVCKTGGGHFFLYLFRICSIKKPWTVEVLRNGTDGTDAILLQRIEKKIYKICVYKQIAILSVPSVPKPWFTCVFRLQAVEQMWTDQVCQVHLWPVPELQDIQNQGSWNIDLRILSGCSDTGSNGWL